MSAITHATQQNSTASGKGADTGAAAGTAAVIIRPPIWIAVVLPQLGMEAFFPRSQWQSGSQAIVIMEQQRSWLMNPAAVQAGVRSGMRRAGIELLCHDARFQQRDTQREQALLQQCAEVLLQFTPSVCMLAPATVLMDVTASLRLFGGIRLLRKRIRHVLAALDVSACTAVAPVAMAAALLARHAAAIGKTHALCLQMPRLAARLNRIPVHFLLQAAPYLSLLEGIACHKLGDLRRLPRAGLQRRTSAALLQETDQLYGERPAPLVWHVEAEHCEFTQELPDRMERSDQLQPYLQRLLTRLCSWLQRRQLATAALTIRLPYERGRQAIAPAVLTLELTSAGWQMADFWPLLKEKLALLSLSHPVIALHLQVPQTQALPAGNGDLFPDAGMQTADHQRLLALLATRLGADQVCRPAHSDEHLPERANQWVSVMQPVSARQRRQISDHTTALYRPAWLLAQPQALSLRDEKPWWHGPLQIISAAERVETGWWSEHAGLRDYFIAVGSNHVQYWIFRERPLHAGDVSRWYLHGVFG